MKFDKQHLQDAISGLAKEWEQERIMHLLKIKQLEKENQFISELVSTVKKNILTKCSRIEEFKLMTKGEIEKELKYLMEEVSYLELNISKSDAETYPLRSEMEDLQKSLSEFLDEMKRYKNEKNRLLHLKQQYKETIAAKSAEINELISTKPAVETRIRGLESRIRLSEDENKPLKEELKLVETEARNLTIEHSMQFEEYEMLREKVKKLETEKERLASERNSHLKKIEDDKIKCAFLEKDIDELEREKQAGAKNIEEIKKECEKERAYILQLQENMKVLKAEKLAKYKRDLRESINNVNTEKLSYKKEKIDLDFEIMRLESKIRYLEKEG